MNDESVQDATAPQPFAICATKATASRVTHLKWSPKVQDLIAVAFENAPLTLYRLPWKRVWSYRNAALVTAMEWSPDGKWLAAGFDDGSVHCLSKESGKMSHSFRYGQEEPIAEAGRTTTESVVCLHWAHRERGSDGKEEARQNREEELFQDVPSEVQKQPLDATEMYKEFDQLNTMEATEVRGEGSGEESAKGILCVVNQMGTIDCYVAAKVPIAEFDSRKMSDGPASKLITYKAVMMDDFSSILLLRLLQKGKCETDAWIGTLQLVLCDCGAIGVNTEKISSFILKFSQVLSLLEKAEACLGELHKTWSETLNVYHAVLRDNKVHDPLNVIVEELTIFLGLYIVTDNLAKFADGKWTKLWLQRTSHNLDAALHVMNDLINDHLRSQLQKALVIVDELCGMADSQAVLGEKSFGTEISELHLLRSRLRWLLLGVDQIYNKLHELGRGYRSFLCLLLFVRQVTENESVEDATVSRSTDVLITFMNGELQRDTLLCEFELLSSQTTDSRSELFSGLQENKPLFEMTSKVLGPLAQTELRTGMRQQLKQTIKHMKTCLLEIKNHFSRSITCVQKVDLSGNVTKEPVLTAFALYPGLEDGDKRFVIVYNSEGGRLRNDSLEGIVTAKGAIARSTSGIKLNLEPCTILVPQDFKLVDLCLSGCSDVFVLMECESTSQAEIARLPIGDMSFVTEEQAKKSRHPLFEVGMDQVLEAEEASDVVSQDLAKASKAFGVGWDAMPMRQRTHKFTGVRVPLAASSTGLVIVVSNHRVVIYDSDRDEMTP